MVLCTDIWDLIINYPPEARHKRIQGRIFVSFVIQKDGSIDKELIKVIKDVSPSLDAEAIRVIKEMQHGMQVNIKVCLRK